MDGRHDCVSAAEAAGTLPFFRESGLRGSPVCSLCKTAPPRPVGELALLIMRPTYIYQIRTFYSKDTDIDPAYRVLDNSANERPDWYEYWPIRRFLLNEQLNEDALYGFFSPRFKEKTNLSSSAVFDFIAEHGATADVVLFSPSIHLTAYYWNVFEYGEYCHPGLRLLAEKFFARIGRPSNLKDLVTYSRNEVYSNYFVATPRFWRKWLEITEQLIALAESPTDPLGAELQQPTDYRGHREAQIKIFIMERIPTWLLATEREYEIEVRDPFVVRSRVYKLPAAIVCDALKISYVQSGRQPQYKELFRMVSAGGRLFGLVFRLGNWVGISPIRRALASLSSYWTKAGDA